MANRIYQPKANIPYVRLNYILAGLSSSILWLYKLGVGFMSATSVSLYLNTRFMGLLAVVIWLLLDMGAWRDQTNFEASYSLICPYFLLLFIFLGPSTSFSLGWGLREELLVKLAPLPHFHRPSRSGASVAMNYLLVSW